MLPCPCCARLRWPVPLLPRLPRGSSPFPRGTGVIVPAPSFLPLAVVFAVCARALIHRSFRARRPLLSLTRGGDTLLVFGPASSPPPPAALHCAPLSQAPLQEEVIRGPDRVVAAAQQPNRRPFHYRCRRRRRSLAVNVSATATAAAATLGPPPPSTPRERYRPGKELVVDVGAPARHGRVGRRLGPRGRGVGSEEPLVLPDLGDVRALRRVGVEDSRQEVCRAFVPVPP